MNLHQLYLTKNQCFQTGKTINVSGIMIHSTGANNPNLKRYVGPDDGLLGNNIHNNHWNQYQPDGRQVCVHAFIGKLADGTVATYQTLPWNMRGWHCGVGSKGSGNDTHIGFEICEDSLTDVFYFKKVYQEAVELTAYLCRLFNLNPMEDGVVICHSEGHKRGIASNHSDVTHWWGNSSKSGAGYTMDMFRKAVKKTIEEVLSEGNETGGENNDAQNEQGNLYRVQVGAFSKKENANKTASELKEKGYATYIVQTDNLYKVQCGAFGIKENAVELADKLEKDGFNTYIH